MISPPAVISPVITSPTGTALAHSLSTDWGSGHITFTAESNNTGVVSEFVFNVITSPEYGGNRTYTEVDISAVAWAINSSDRSFILDLVVSETNFEFGVKSAGVTLSNSGNTNPHPCFGDAVMIVGSTVCGSFGSTLGGRVRSNDPD